MTEKTTSRRGLFFVLGGLIAVGAGWQAYLGRSKELVFEPIAGLPEWRRVAFESVTQPGGNASAAIFLGIGEDDNHGLWPPDQLCSALYPDTSEAQGKLPVAVFSDVNCPNCRRLEAKLEQRRERLTLNWIELPLLGPTSVPAAKAALAASLQPGGTAFRAQAMSRIRGGRMHPDVLAAATEAGLDPEKLIADFSGPEVAALLRRNHAMAGTLGVWGTPAMTIGQTLVMGDVENDVLDQLIDIETARGKGRC